jgi:hypothetical protein
VDIITSRPRLVNLIVEIPDNMGLAILVTDVPFVQVINKVFFHLVPGFCHRGRVVDTLEAAYALVIQAETKNG